MKSIDEEFTLWYCGPPTMKRYHALNLVEALNAGSPEPRWSETERAKFLDERADLRAKLDARKARHWESLREFLVKTGPLYTVHEHVDVLGEMARLEKKLT